jgi:hypothetical protein
MTTITIDSQDPQTKTKVKLTASTADPKKAEEIGRLVAIILSTEPQPK